jgi:hypothetical protein
LRPTEHQLASRGTDISRLLWRKDGGSPGREADIGRFTTVDQDDAELTALARARNRPLGSPEVGMPGVDVREDRQISGVLARDCRRE